MLVLFVFYMNTCVAIITGGQGDLAQAIGERGVLAGWEIHCPGRSELDVTVTESVQQYIARYPRIDLLINNAGVTADGLMLTLTEQEWQQVIEVNLSGAFRCSRAVLQRMCKQRQGHIINISSYSALAGPVGQANYAAAKAGLIALTQSIAKEYGSRGIRCNCVLPGFLQTRMTQHLTDQRRAEILAEHSLGRFNTVAQAADFILLLQKMENISGQVFQLDSRVSA
jgi:3-oxoacyl-[acyl-carrier protein] reductase